MKKKIIKNGLVYNSVKNTFEQKDILINNGIVEKLGNVEECKDVIIIDASGLLVTPGLIDFHAHVYPLKPLPYNSLNPVDPDACCFASGVTTVVDAGTSGWRDFVTFKENVIDKSKVRIFAFLNVSRRGMLDLEGENEVSNLDPKLTAAYIKSFPDILVGVKTAHYWTTKPFDDEHPMWASVDAALEAGELSEKRVMVDFYPNLPDRTYPDMLKRLRPGDIHTHMYAPQFEIIEKDGTVAPFIWEARERGVLFDVGHGGVSFVFRNAIPAIKCGHIPFTISSDLYTNNIMGPVFSLLEVMNKFLNIGLTLEDVLHKVTLAPAKLLGKEELGVIKEGGIADIAFLKQREENCSFIDGGYAKINGSCRLECRATMKDGEFVFNPNGYGCVTWENAPEEYWTKNCRIKY